MTENHLDASNSIYGEHLEELKKISQRLMTRIDEIREEIKGKRGSDPVDHCLTRIKSEKSMREKCQKRGLPENSDSALFKIYDAIGIRIICAFLNDVYLIRDYLKESKDFQIVEEKDYIRKAKPNGYRSLHLIIQVDDCWYAEIQLRTISMDTWAALEHKMKYKKNIGKNTDLIVKELKRCADELASTDVSMQTIRDMIEADSEDEYYETSSC